MSKDAPAFPIPGKTFHYDEWKFTDPDYVGMSLRDYFAGQALPACIRQCAHDTLPDGMTREDFFADAAYRCADAMLKARGEQ